MIMIINNINDVYAITMIICLCNGITDKQIDCAAKEGAVSWRDVHATYGKAPQCGSCQCEINKQISKHQAHKATKESAPSLSFGSSASQLAYES
jgi:bacterioferritin-associated ferredoxin